MKKKIKKKTECENPGQKYFFIKFWTFQFWYSSLKISPFFFFLFFFEGESVSIQVSNYILTNSQSLPTLLKLKRKDVQNNIKNLPLHFFFFKIKWSAYYKMKSQVCFFFQTTCICLPNNPQWPLFRYRLERKVLIFYLQVLSTEQYLSIRFPVVSIRFPVVSILSDRFLPWYRGCGSRSVNYD